MYRSKPLQIPTPEQALPGRQQSITVAEQHFVNGHVMQAPFPSQHKLAMFGLGCFWGAEKKFWQQASVYSSAVGYAAGFTANPTYQEVCSGLTGHNEVVRVVFDPAKISYQSLLQVFWTTHNPTQGMQQGNDKGTQYRSGIYCYDDAQMALALDSKLHFQQRLEQAGLAQITTEIISAPEFYFAEDYHQQYLAKNPQGYCGLGGTGVDY